MLLLTDLPPGRRASGLPQGHPRGRRMVGRRRVFLSDLPQDAGLVRIGSEILCYDSIDTSNGLLTIATGGRGLLGTTEETHEAGESITFLEPLVVTTLAGSVSAGGSALPLEDPTDFPREGTVLVDGELLHYPHLAGSVLEMPRASSRPGAMDENGDGLPRRFAPRSRPMPRQPGILFPFRSGPLGRSRRRARARVLRIVDRSAQRLLRGVFFRPRAAGHEDRGAQAAIPRCLGRRARGGAEERSRADRERPARRRPLPINRQRDAIEWRVFVRTSRAPSISTWVSHGGSARRAWSVRRRVPGSDLTLRRVDE